MKVSMPRGSTHGWGVAGTYLSLEIAKLPPLDNCTLHCISSVALDPYDSSVWDSKNIGYCFFEANITLLNFTRHAAKLWDFIVAGSSWCEYNLRIGGVKNTATVLQGIDSDIFYPGPKRKYNNSFVVFSGGKFELRKSQDMVIAAMRVFMERHPDVLLSCAWYNQWPFSLDTMELSNYIAYNKREADCLDILCEILLNNGIPLERVLLHPVLNNTQMREVYLDSDVGLFPNRGEGGNNLVMCEYMACGKTVIASDMTGQGDVITSENSLPLTTYKPYYYRHNTEGIWFEPCLDEIIEKLEYAYTNQRELRLKGLRAAQDMAALTWNGAARQFYEIGKSLL